MKIILTPEDEARHKFDAENNVEPARTIAIRIAGEYGHNKGSTLVDDIAHAIEDALNLGEKRGKLLAMTTDRG